MMPLVSICIPCFRYERYIVDCLMSCCNQDYDNVEIVVVDDASPDRSAEMVQKVRDPRIKLIRHKENKGYSAAKNTGIRASKGEYITTLDSDDMLTLVSISKRVRFLKEHTDVDVVHGIAYKVAGGCGYGKALLKQEKFAFDTRCKIHAQGVMVRRSAYEKYGLYYEAMRSKADKEMWQRMLLLGAKFTKISTKCAFYRMHEKSMLSMRNRNPDYDRKVTKLYYKRIEDVKKRGMDAIEERL